MPGTSLPHALVVEDEALLLDAISMALGRTGSLRISRAHDASEALAIARVDLPDVVITDVKMPGISGLELLELLRNDFPTLPIVVMSAFGPSVRRQALRKGATHFLDKPFPIAELRGVLQSVLVKRGSMMPTPSDASFEGAIESLSVPDIIQVACMTRGSARIELSSSAGSGLLFIEGSNVVDAEWEGRSGIDAVRAAMSLGSGRFRVYSGTSHEPRSIHMPWTELVMECARLQDEQRASSAEAPSPVVQPPAGPATLASPPLSAASSSVESPPSAASSSVGPAPAVGEASAGSLELSFARLERRGEAPSPPSSPVSPAAQGAPFRLLQAAEALGQISRIAGLYLGKSVLANYWQNTMPEGLAAFRVERGMPCAQGEDRELSADEAAAVRRWVDSFLRRGEKIVVELREESRRGLASGHQEMLGLDGPEEELR